MRFATRIFLGSFLPFALLLAVSFWAVRTAVVATVRKGLRDSAREHQVAMVREQARSDERVRRILRGVAENPVLKAGLQLLSSDNGAPGQARNTVQDQLSELCDSLSFDFMVISNARGEPLAAVTRQAVGFAPLNIPDWRPPEHGVFSTGGHLYEVTSVPIYESGAQVATLSTGALFDLSRFGVTAVLLHDGAVAAAHPLDLASVQTQEALRNCQAGAECEVRIRDERYLSLPLGASASLGNGYVLRSLQSVDAASAAVQAVLRRLFLIAGLVVLAAALGVSLLTSRSIARPLAEVAARLKESISSGELPEFPEGASGAKEIRDLTRVFNQAARAVSEGRERLTRAYVEFAGSLAQALDARDPYTAGHSRRVSEYSCDIATAMGLPNQEVETIRVGTLLHDLGKIGISDLVLQKPGPLTPDENELIRNHPVIGRRIVENVRGLELYLPIIELHHENWDGTGYPLGLKGEEIPLYARIVRVADTYDAMTSDRPYRRGMGHAQAIAILRRVAGSQVDGEVVEIFSGLGAPAHAEPAQGLQNLAQAVMGEGNDHRMAAATPRAEVS